MQQLIYKGKIRDGAVGTLTVDEYSVIFDSDLEYAYLDPMPVIEASMDSAWKDYLNRSGQTKDIAVVFRKPNND